MRIKVWLLLLAAPAAALVPPADQWHWVAVDSSEIRIPKLDSVARRLGFKRDAHKVWGQDEKSIRYREIGPVLFTAFSFTQAGPGYSDRSGAWDSTWAVAFLGGGDRYEAILASAYLQEVRPGFRDSFPAFREYREINPDRFSGRMWLSAGWAWQAALSDNAVATPFQRHMIPFGYAVDGFAAVFLAAAATPGLAPEDRLGAVAFAVGFTVFERLLMLPLGHFLIRQHNGVIRSGYRIPDFNARTQTPRAPPR